MAILLLNVSLFIRSGNKMDTLHQIEDLQTEHILIK